MPAGMLARVAAVTETLWLLDPAAPPIVAHLTPSQVRDALVALCASGQLVDVYHLYAIHPNALRRVLQSLRAPTSLRDVARLLSASRQATHTLLRWLLGHGDITVEHGRYHVTDHHHAPAARFPRPARRRIP